MPAKTLYIVQQFDRIGKRIVAGRQMEQPSAEAAAARAERDATRCAGVVAVQQTVDTETGEVLEEPILRARFGELPAGMAGTTDSRPTTCLEYEPSASFSDDSPLRPHPRAD